MVVGVDGVCFVGGCGAMHIFPWGWAMDEVMLALTLDVIERLASLLAVLEDYANYLIALVGRESGALPAARKQAQEGHQGRPSHILEETLSRPGQG